MSKLMGGSLFASLLVMFASSSWADFVYSTSSINPNAGSSLELVEGASGQLHVWISTQANQTLIALGFNILESNSIAIDATGHNVINGGRWSTVQAGALNSAGDLINNHRAFFLPTITAGTGISTTGLADFVLHSSFQFNAIAVGSTDLSFTTTSGGVSQLGGGGNIWNSITKGTAFVNVIAVPEPGSVMLIGLAAVAMDIVRRRR